ncbi:TnpV protein [Cytobacillus kochii]|nr:TnpV protein [Cytobacillus kochii]
MREDGNLYPKIELSSENNHMKLPLGRYGKMGMEYLQEKNPIRFQELQMEGTLMEVFHQVDLAAKESILDRMMELEKKNPMPVTEDILKKAQHKNQLKEQAEEIVLKEVVYQVR